MNDESKTLEELRDQLDNLPEKIAVVREWLFSLPVEERKRHREWFDGMFRTMREVEGALKNVVEHTNELIMQEDDDG